MRCSLRCLTEEDVTSAVQVFLACAMWSHFSQRHLLVQCANAGSLPFPSRSTVFKRCAHYAEDTGCKPLSMSRSSLHVLGQATVCKDMICALQVDGNTLVSTLIVPSQCCIA